MYFNFGYILLPYHLKWFAFKKYLNFLFFDNFKYYVVHVDNFFYPIHDPLLSPPTLVDPFLPPFFPFRYILKITYFDSMCMSVLRACMYLHSKCACLVPEEVSFIMSVPGWCLRESEDSIGSPVSGVTPCCEPPCVLELNPGPLKGHSVLNALSLWAIALTTCWVFFSFRGLFMVACMNLNWGHLLEPRKFTSGYHTKEDNFFLLLDYILIEFCNNALFSMS